MYKIHVEIGSYQFVEAEFDTLVEAKIAHDEIKKVWAGETIEGMSRNDWAKFVDNFNITGKYINEELDQLSPLQRWWVHQQENSMQRIIKKNK